VKDVSRSVRRGRDEAVTAGSPWIVKFATDGRVSPEIDPGVEPGSIWMMSPMARPEVVKADARLLNVVTLSTGTPTATTKRAASKVRSSSGSSCGRTWRSVVVRERREWENQLMRDAPG
jgi:hypothetical protein